MAQAVGADLAHMDATEVAFLIDPQQTVRGILVNGRGQRYVPEDTYSGRIGQLTLYHQDDTAYLIIDGDAQDEAMAATSATPFLKRPATWVCESVAELEGEIGLPAGSLQATVAAYNDAAARGEDPLLHKKSEWCKPIGTPVGAIDLRGQLRWFHARRADDHLGLRGAARQRRPDSRPVCGGALHRGRGGVGLCQRNLPWRWQLLRPTRRPRRRQELTFRLLV